jgi:hypothetical protein
LKALDFFILFQAICFLSYSTKLNLNLKNFVDFASIKKLKFKKKAFLDYRSYKLGTEVGRRTIVVILRRLGLLFS